MNKREIAQKQLEQLYQVTQNDEGRRLIIRNWCVTVWLAILVAIVTKRVEVEFWHAVFLALTPLLIFGPMECLVQTFLSLNLERAAQLERMIVDTECEELSSNEHCYVTSYTKIGLGIKLQTLLHVFLRPYVAAFYGALLLISISFIIFVI